MSRKKRDYAPLESEFYLQWAPEGQLLVWLDRDTDQTTVVANLGHNPLNLSDVNVRMRQFIEEKR